MTTTVRSVRRQKKPGVAFRSSGGITYLPNTYRPLVASGGSHMSAETEDTIEVRIARWLETGEGEDSLIGDIAALVEGNRGRLRKRFGEQIAHDVVESGADRVWQKLRGWTFISWRSFSPWLSVVLRNACRDERRRQKRHAKPFSAISEDDHGDQALSPSENAGQSSLDDGIQIAEVVKEVERLLDAENRLIFAVAAGLAEHLDRPVLDRWCAEIERIPSLRSAIDELLETPVFGRQEALAPLFDIRPATCRKRFQRATEKLADSPLLKKVRRLLYGEKPPAG